MKLATTNFYNNNNDDNNSTTTPKVTYNPHIEQGSMSLRPSTGQPAVCVCVCVCASVTYIFCLLSIVN